MSDVTRRDFGMVLAALAAVGGTRLDGQGIADPPLANSEVFHYDKLPVKTGANGNESRAVLHGTLPTGEFIEVHETTLEAGQMPHPPHRHSHSELLLIRSGLLEVNNGAAPARIGPGDIAFTASNLMHGLKNIGTTPAMYFVVAIGKQTAEA